MRRALAIAWLLSACGAKSTLEVPPPAVEASREDAGQDAGTDAGLRRRDAGPRRDGCVGRIVWREVALCARWDPIELYGCRGWREPLAIEASCAGEYTVCARVQSQRGCEIAESCVSVSMEAAGSALLQVPQFDAFAEGCELHAVTSWGAEVCMHVAWSGEESGERELGCFAEAGPWRRTRPRPDGSVGSADAGPIRTPLDAGPPPEPRDAGPPGSSGDDGEWTF
jgi:predicted small lipoprotein YifL